MKGAAKLQQETEMNMIRIGPMQIFAYEALSRDCRGRIVNLPGTDFDVAPVEIPHFMIL